MLRQGALWGAHCSLATSRGVRIFPLAPFARQTAPSAPQFEERRQRIFIAFLSALRTRWALRNHKTMGGPGAMAAQLLGLLRQPPIIAVLGALLAPFLAFQTPVPACAGAWRACSSSWGRSGGSYPPPPPPPPPPALLGKQSMILPLQGQIKFLEVIINFYRNEFAEARGGPLRQQYCAEALSFGKLNYHFFPDYHFWTMIHSLQISFDWACVWGSPSVPQLVLRHNNTYMSMHHTSIICWQYVPYYPRGTADASLQFVEHRLTHEFLSQMFNTTERSAH